MAKHSFEINGKRVSFFEESDGPIFSIETIVAPGRFCGLVDARVSREQALQLGRFLVKQYDTEPEPFDWLKTGLDVWVPDGLNMRAGGVTQKGSWYKVLGVDGAWVLFEGEDFQVDWSMLTNPKLELIE